MNKSKSFKIFSMYAIIFVVQLIFVVSVEAAGQYTESISPTLSTASSSGGTTEILAVSRDERYAAIKVREDKVAETEIDRSIGAGYLLNIASQSFEPLVVDSDGNTMDFHVDGLAFSHDSQRVIFISDSEISAEQPDKNNWIYIKHLDSGELVYFEEHAEMTWADGFTVVTGENSDVAFIFSGSMLLQLNIQDGEIRSHNTGYPNTGSNYCDIHNVIPLNSGDIVVSDWCSYAQFNAWLVDTDNNWQSLYSDEFSYSKIAIAAHASTLVIPKGRGEITLINWESEEETELRLQSDFATFGQSDEFFLSPDAKYLVVNSWASKARGDKDNVLLAYELTTMTNAVLSTHASGVFVENIFDAYFSSSNNFYYVARVDGERLERSKQIYRTEVNEATFSSPETSLQNVNLSTKGIFKTEVSLTDTGGLVAAYRSNKAKELHDIIVFPGSGGEDYQQGLQAVNFEYEFFSCSKNLVCNITDSIVKSIDVQDFNSLPQISVSYRGSTFSDETLGIVFSVANPESRAVELSTLSSGVSYGNKASLSYGVDVSLEDGPVLFRSRFCVENFDSTYSCSDQYSTSDVFEVSFDANFFAQVLTDHSGIKLSWDNSGAETYQLFQSPRTGEKKLIAEGTTEQSFIDTSLSVGDEMGYKLILCKASFCREFSSFYHKLDRSREATLGIRQYTTHSEIKISTNYAYEQLHLYRKAVDFDAPLELVSTFTGNYRDLNFTIDESLSGVSYIYVLEACAEQSCTRVATRTHTGRQFDYRNVSVVRTPANVSVKSAFLHQRVVWDSVPGVTGYRIVQKDSGKTINFAEVLAGEELQAFFSVALNRTYDYEVRSYFGKNALNRRYSQSAKVTKIATEEIFSSKDVVPPKIQGISPLYWPFRYGDDYYLVYFKTSSEPDFKLIDRLTFSQRAQIRDYYPPVEIKDNELAQLYIVACSEYVNVCSGPSNTVSWFNASDNLISPPPTVSWDENENAVKVIANVPDDTFDKRIVFDSSRTSAIEQIADNVWFDRYKLKQGQSRSYQTRYCYIASPGERCSGYSESVEFEIPETVPMPPPSMEIESIVQNSDNKWLVEIRNCGSSSCDGEAYRFDYVNVMRSIDFQLPELIVEINVDEFERLDSQTLAYELVDDLPDEPAVVSYVIEACNSAGCGNQTIETIVINQASEPQIPDIPVFTLSPKINVADILIDDLGLHRDINILLSTDGENFDIEHTFSGNSFTIPELIESTQYYLKAQACNIAGCSDYSESIPFTTKNQALATADFEPSLLTPNELFEESGRTGALEGRLDVFSGELRSDFYVDISEGGEFEFDLYLHNGDVCKQLFSHDILLLDGVSYANDTYKEVPVFTVVNTAGNCRNELADLSANSVLLVSPFLSAPMVFTESSLKQWFTLKLVIAENGQLSFYSDEQLLTVSDLNIQLPLFGIAKHQWEVGDRNEYPVKTGLSALRINTSSEQHLVQPKEFYEDSAFASMDSIHPRSIRYFGYGGGGHNDGATRLRVWHLVDNGYEILSEIFKETSEYRLNGYIGERAPNQMYEYFLQGCYGDICQPALRVTVQTPRYTEITSWSEPNGNATEEAMQVAFRYSVVNNRGYADDVTLKLISEQTGEIIETRSLSFADYFAENYFLPSWNFGTLTQVFNGLDMDDSYAAQLEVCNPIGCYDTALSYYVKPAKDTDGDGVIDDNDAFPMDSTEWADSDSDGIGDNADLDIDGDGIPNTVEIELGLDPTNSLDGVYDLDGDGFDNAYEYITGSDPAIASDTPQSQGYFESFEGGGQNQLQISNGTYCSSCARLHGYATAYSYYRTDENGLNEISLTYTGALSPGKVYFMSDKSNFELNIQINEQDTAIQLQKEFEFVRPYWQSENHRYIYSFELETISTNPVELKLTFSRESNDLNLDAFLLPTEDPSSNSRTVADFDGDGKSDLVVRNTETFVNFVKSIETQTIQRISFGKNPQDIPVEGDFDGDGLSDIAVRRVSNSTWYIKRSSDSEIERVVFGRNEEDIPVPADYDGDGKTDIAVRRPSNQFWYILQSSDGEIVRHNFGLQSDDIPVPADYDGDGKADIAVRRPSNQFWYILQSSDGEIVRHNFGLQSDDIPVPADYDGDGKADIAVRRPSTQYWYILQSSDGEIRREVFGLQASDVPVIADYDGDGKSDIAVRRANSFMWYILRSSDGEIVREKFGLKEQYVPLMAPVSKKMSMLSLQ